MGVLDAMLPQPWRGLCCSQMIWLSCEISGEMKFSSTSKNIWTWDEKAKVEAERARDEAEQHGYNVGVAETEDTLLAEVLVVCRIYCAQTWEKALNQVGVEASFELRRPENIYFPPAIRASDLPFAQGEVASTVADPIEEAQSQDPLPPN